ncbi:MAG: tRNA uridine(34) 5-carboxymethylaminomethyl modification radical SAM/GNAT enzyme Elp3 [Patescibacteria group bacterium]
MTEIEKIILEIYKFAQKDEKFLAKKFQELSGLMKLEPVSKIKLLKAYRNLLKKKTLEPDKPLEKYLKRRKVRTASGVAVISVLTKFFPCPGKCTYCPQEKNMPRSYLSNEPAVMRAVLNDFDPYRQTQTRLQSLKLTGHLTDKIELIVIGGTWSALPKRYQNWFIKRCFQACNDFPQKKPLSKLKLNELQLKNETAKHRIIGLTLETRPDHITPEEIKQMRQLGCTRLEIGVQSLSDEVLKLNHRGHKVARTIQATKLLKDAGFKICYHLMPNLFGSTPTKDLNDFKKLFSDQNFQPDMLKVYPTVVVKGSQLYTWFKSGKYKPYADKVLIDLLIKIKQTFPPYVRVNRLIRDIPSTSIEGGNKVSNLREIIQKEAIKQGHPCQCIRCREIKGDDFDLANVKLIRRDYRASDGQEIFLSFEDTKQDKLLAFLRLRLPAKPNDQIFPELKNSALIREVHTYGNVVEFDQHGTDVQHLGLGKKMMLEAEAIAKQNDYQKIAVISGVGVRGYYKKIGYKLEGTYMTKKLDYANKKII